MNLFDRAKSVGLQTIKQWLPGGRIEGSEYVTFNPTRMDTTLNTFKINLSSGLWSDFKTGDSGADAVSCFAYCNYSEMERRARENNYKNIDGGIQKEAAEEILAIYDLDYYPDPKDTFKIPTKKKGDFWEGFHQLNSGVKDPPNNSEAVQWMIDNVKEIESVKKQWHFTDKKGYRLFSVVRFISDGKKSDRPFTLWKNGNELKWRCKGFKELTDSGFKIPLYNRHKFEIDENLPILMVEGQKCADTADALLSDLFLCTTEYGGLKNCELEVLRGKTVYRWIDPDNAGVKKLAKFKELTKDFDIILHVVKSPVRKPKGWDIADAIEEGWSKEKLIEHIEKTEGNNEDSFIEDGLDFKIIGATNTDIFFFPRGSKLVKSYKQNGLTKNSLMTLMDRKIWGDYFAKSDGGIAWDSAVNYILRRAENVPFYYNTIIRGAGAWKDRERLVINCGSHLIVDGKKADLYGFDSDYIYEKKDAIPYTMHDAFSTDQSKELIDILNMIDFSHRADHLILSGWILLSAFGGALKWRPKVWLSGPRGSGKSYIIDEIITPLVGKDFGHIAPGTSSEAAIRRQAGTNSLPNIHDEMESDNKHYSENINNILMFYRVGSSGDNGGIIKVADNGNIQKWISQCMALFASIGAAIKNGADRSRITVINLKPPSPGKIKKRESDFKELEEKVSMFTKSWSIGFHSRTLQIWNEVERCIKIMVSVCTLKLGARREGDQLGTLLAGAYMVNHDKAPIASEAVSWIDSLDIENISSDKFSKSDEMLVIDEILSNVITVSEKMHTYKMSIGNLLIYWFINNGVGISTGNIFDDINYDSKTIKMTLDDYGIKPVYQKSGSYISIAKGHPKIKDILKNTAWVDNYTEFLKRLPMSDKGEHGPTNFSGVSKRFIKIDAVELLDQPPF